MTSNAHPTVALHIERVVIDGIPLNMAERAQVRTALQRELTMLLERDPADPAMSGEAVPDALAPAIDVVTPVQPDQLGRQVAQSVFASLRGSP